VVIEFDPERPVWRQIAADIRRKIESGEYRPGSRMPSENDLAEGYGVSRTTVRTVINALRADGSVVVEQRPGHPRATYVSNLVEAQVITLGQGDHADYRGSGTVIVTRANGEIEQYPAAQVRMRGEA
jgi:DNA-binding FadR family transcriptional regulator